MHLAVAIIQRCTRAGKYKKLKEEQHDIKEDYRNLIRTLSS